jgi:hypothetical protein
VLALAASKNFNVIATLSSIFVLPEKTSQCFGKKMLLNWENVHDDVRFFVSIMAGAPGYDLSG